MCIIMCSPIKSEAALFDTGTIMNGGDSFLNNAENREIFNADNERSAVDQIYYVMLYLLDILKYLNNFLIFSYI